MKRTLFIFEHKKGLFISIENKVLIAFTAFLFFLVYLESTENFDFGNLIIYIGIIYFLTLFGILASNLFLHQNKNGEFKGKLEFEENFIKANEIVYPIDEIDKIIINANDFEGKYVNTALQFSRHISNGLDNEIILKLKNGNKVKYNFFQSKGQRINNFREILISYHLSGKISWLYLLEILEINDYDEIQKFKNTLKKS